MAASTVIDVTVSEGNAQRPFSLRPTLTLASSDDSSFGLEELKAEVVVNAEKPSTARQRRRQMIALLAATHPVVLRTDRVDLATEEEKRDPLDSWFAKKFGTKQPKLSSCPSKTTGGSFCHVKEKLKKGEISTVDARVMIKRELERNMAEKRRKEQKRRTAVYNEDNFLNIQDEEEEKEEILSDVETEASDGEKEEEADAGSDDELDEEEEAKEIEVDKKAKCAFLDDEAEESDEDTGEERNDDNDDEPARSGSGSMRTLSKEEVAAPEGFLEANETSLANSRLGRDVFADDLLDLTLPATLSQWVNGRRSASNSAGGCSQLSGSQKDLLDSSSLTGSSVVQKVLQLASGSFGSVFPRMGAEGVPSSSTSTNDILALCSGTFTAPALSSSRLSAAVESDDDEVIPQRSSRRRKVVLSDSEDEDEENVAKQLCGSEKGAASAKLATLFAESSDDDEEESVEKAKEEEEEEDGGENDEEEKGSDAGEGDVEHGDDGKGSVNSAEVDDGDESEEEADDRDVDESPADSSDDELAVYRRLQKEVPIGGNRPEKAKKNHLSEYFDEEASLSGDDVGSDDDEDEEGLNEYEAEAGDHDELPDAATIMEQVQQQYMKQQQDEEDRNLLYWKDQLLMDGDLHGETNRTFRFRLREEAESVGIDGGDDGAPLKEEDDEEDPEIRKKRIEMIKWKIDNEADEDVVEDENESPFMHAGIVALQRSSSSSTTSSSLQGSLSSGTSRNSLLQHRQSLSRVVNHLGPPDGHSNYNKGLFVSKGSKALKRPSAADAESADPVKKAHRPGILGLL